MADSTAIEWTNATWNPVTGCTKIGPGCDNCYAERFAERWRGVAGHPYEQGFDLTLWPNRLSQPAAWKKPRMIFVNSMSDRFHKEVDRSFIDKVFDVMERVDRHVYQVLTKRSSLMRACPSSKHLGHLGLFLNGGSGSSWLMFSRLVVMGQAAFFAIPPTAPGPSFFAMRKLPIRRIFSPFAVQCGL